jgi:L-lactate dehydrogenase complex protein LldE
LLSIRPDAAMIQRKHFDTPPTRVALFVTCMVDMLYPDVGMATVELLERHGVQVIFPYEQTCCGQPAFNSGFRDEARALARRYLDVFEPFLTNGLVDAIVAPSGSCTTMVSHFYTALFEDPAFAAERRRAEALAEVTFELTEFLVDVLGVTDTGAHFEGKLTYHACCHLLRELGIDRQPKTLLANLQDAELVELGGSEECCGFGGLFALKNADISTAMGQRKSVNLVQSGADVVALCDVSCMTHINGILSRQALGVRAVHIAEILANQIEVAEPAPPASSPPPPSSTSAGPKPPATPAPRPRRWQDIR